MKKIKNLTETAISFFVIGTISIIYSFKFSGSYSAEFYYSTRSNTPQYSFLGIGIFLILVAIVILVVVMDKLSSRPEKHLKPKKTNVI